jgi:predicted RNase H-like nuclease
MPCRVGLFSPCDQQHVETAWPPSALTDSPAAAFLDAAVLAWAAHRIHLGQAVSFPSPPEDLSGVAAAIWA